MPVTEQTFSSQILRRVPFRDADNRIDILSRAQQAFSESQDDSELLSRLIAMSFAGIEPAMAIAVVRLDADGKIDLLGWDRRLEIEPAVDNATDFKPSESLIRQTIANRQSTSHEWTSDGQPSHLSGAVDWAFCTPFLTDACQKWALYVEGTSNRRGTSHDVREDIKFAELLVNSFTSLRQARMDEQNRAHFRQFFSPVVLQALARYDPAEVLAPREADVAVLFCDLRGFSRRSEKEADDLFGLLQRVSDALGVTTRQILAHGGVVGDFHGDAAMGFWGWPFEKEDNALRACRAALAISREFAEFAARPENPLADFRIGIGVATGRAVAGKIGTTDQVKVTVFGPVVNLAARLEGMTDVVGAPILLDAKAAAAARAALRPNEARIRTVATVQPYGFESTFEIHELVADDRTILQDEDISSYERALHAFNNGDWADALVLLQKVPRHDRVRKFLESLIRAGDSHAPDDWCGTVRLESK